MPSFIDGVYEAQLIVNNQLDRETLQGAYTFVTQVITSIANSFPSGLPCYTFCLVVYKIMLKS